MNSMIENLVIDMRALGIKSLALELSESPGSLPTATYERETLAPGEPEPEPKDPSLCAVHGCGEKCGGVLGGQLQHLCRQHAFGILGVRSG